ncbi:hypothetical protein [Clostridium intestinale]|uniref:hypothetical protein n=1 Tax=Clostridium intestinale TaxID=36845 RepID=UPI0028E83559|nr:hypothetical protein [Clostridium intestinale]
MRGTTVIMVLASLWFLILGTSILLSKKVRGIIESASIANDKTAYVRFNAFFNLCLGGIGVLLGVVDYFFKEYSLYIVGAYAVIMISAGLIQGRLSARYK